MNIRIGFGVDVHRLADTHELFIGGKRIESDLGAVGHSDADVLLHAICDALLGAANLRDIGFHFSDTDPAYKGIDSKILLADVFKLLQAKNYAVRSEHSWAILAARLEAQKVFRRGNGAIGFQRPEAGSRKIRDPRLSFRWIRSTKV
jgi:2-C-methyl-D-erythritol 2,4-cyclodiphosphate synthase